ncbi:MAG: serine/threonine-protein kinase, partial [Acidobacteriota bacterium]
MVTAKTRVGTPVPAQRTPSAPVTRSVADELYPGLRIHQYELIRELGRGGMGIVYAARDTKLGRRVAVKFLLDRNRDVADRFLTEARATAQCNHDNIVIVHEVDEHAGTPYMVLEFLEGHTLREVMGPFQASRRLPGSRVVEIGLQIARALSRAHERGIVHRDLKPENVFLTSAGQIKVLDFGIAKPLNLVERAPDIERVATANLQLTRAGALVGTLPYMSLEQLGVGELGPRADVWALGIMLFEMLAGHHPLPGESLAPTALIAHLAGDAPMPAIADAAPGVPEPLARLVERCLRKDYRERPSAADLVRRFEAIQPGRAA